MSLWWPLHGPLALSAMGGRALALSDAVRAWATDTDGLSRAATASFSTAAKLARVAIDATGADLSCQDWRNRPIVTACLSMA